MNYLKHLFSLEEDLNERECTVAFILIFFLIGYAGFVELNGVFLP